MNAHVSKNDWVELFREIGLDDDAMNRWHRAFERKSPAGHQSFLEWLALPEEEIAVIRSRAAL